MGIDHKIALLDLSLPRAADRNENYLAILEHSGLVYVSGQLSKSAEGMIMAGRVGIDVDITGACQAAERCVLSIFSELLGAGYDDHRIDRFVKIVVYVNSSSDFTDQPIIANSASKLIMSILSDNPFHTRTAIGVAVLPFGATVEIEAVVALNAIAP